MKYEHLFKNIFSTKTQATQLSTLRSRQIEYQCLLVGNLLVLNLLVGNVQGGNQLAGNLLMGNLLVGNLLEINLLVGNLLVGNLLVVNPYVEFFMLLFRNSLHCVRIRDDHS